MQDYFYALADFIGTQLQSDEVYLCEFSAENSDFIRFNRGNVRQPGSVEQRFIDLDLIKGNRHASGQLTLSGETRTDHERVIALLSELREQLPHLPEDPYLLYATEVNSSELVNTNILPDAKEALADILNNVQGIDFVGIYAAGGIFTGFANSFGQRNWHSSYSFNLDWSIYHDRDKAVKSTYAGFDWKSFIFQEKMANSIEQLDILRREPRTIEPGQYRVYLSPTALHEILQLLTWGGFGLKAQRTKESPLLRMLEEPMQHLHPSVTLTENTAQGIAPTFQSQGFIKPEQVTLIEKGTYNEALVSPRSAKEYGTNTNGADNEETPSSLDLAAGDFPQADVLNKLDKGIYINNLWYLNYSDRAACRITGMTRFATFWVENGEIQAPLNVMRFDETLYRLLGDNLITLTKERDFIIEADTYEVRSTNSTRLPGALVEAFTFTL
ncbi:metallopeptidase TldD-related protein [Candidatus Parabeggiatoa sp. HSG14]|uniref:TldD/PmbA family protein n=1 Tax=Candidatus Parabeggiatoa sp. HSG14 TaxID=3055593 RepID=UPI0025A708C4|nr:metallopeptidase TldD-related protein [Thiotrichales bacterium HSG14]